MDDKSQKSTQLSLFTQPMHTTSIREKHKYPKPSKPEHAEELPFINPQKWTEPTELPDLSLEQEIAMDIETRDDSITKNMGPGYHKYDRGASSTGYICGISAAWRDQKIYIPIKHPDTRCFGHDLIHEWLRSLFKQHHTKFIFHNYSYDLGWIGAVFGLEPPRQLDDTMAMASMLNEVDSVSLENLCIQYKLLKEEQKLELKIPKSDIYKVHASFVGRYAEQDAVSTLALARKLRPLLIEENLVEAYRVEQDLMPITLKMRQRGIQVDKKKAKDTSDMIKKQVDANLVALSSEYGRQIKIDNLRSNRWLTSMFEELGLPLIPTKNQKAGNYSFDKSIMTIHPHPFPKMVHRTKHIHELRTKFLDLFIREYALGDRIFPTVNQFKTETGGTKSHRFSYSDPPLQQMPSRDDEYAPMVRSCFLPEPGEFWCSIDWRQQEYRLIVYAAEQINAYGAKKAADMYRNDPTIDFHDYAAKLTGLPRRRAKDVNFAKAYGAGVKKFAAMTGMNEDQACEVINQYDNELPFVREVSNYYQRFAKRHGYITMIDGARNHFKKWEPDTNNADKRPGLYACDWEEALERTRNLHPDFADWRKYPLRRALAHKAFNRMIQGSAARQMKKAMVEIYRAGYLPLLQMHDELCFSLSNMKDAKRCAEIMEHAMPQITIPMPTDIEVGPDWGSLKKIQP